MRPFTAIALAVALGASGTGVLTLAGCASAGGVPGLHAAAERSDTDASLLYTAIATTANAIEGSAAFPQTTKDQAEAIKVKAWGLLQIAHKAYAVEQVADTSGLLALLSQIKALKGQ